MRHLLLLSLMLCLAGTGLAQPRATAVEKLALDGGHNWAAPRFSPDGTRIYFTQSGYDGIWEYAVASKAVRKITSDPKSGYGFAIAQDGKSIAYRRVVPGSGRRRTYEIVKHDLASGKGSVQAKGTGLSVPAFAHSALVYSVGKQTKNLARVSTGAVAILGIENTKIALVHNGRKRILDPLGNGSYIWPSLSPDSTRIVAYEMDRGTFVCDLNGRVLAMLGRRDAPVWTRDGKWIVYMDDKDDGHQMQASDLRAVSVDGTRTVSLTSTPDVMEMYPDCSPIDNRIVCGSEEGDIFMISYTEEAQ